nr:FkbM family methyltransferase [uncultured Shinella sp.]
MDGLDAAKQGADIFGDALTDIARRCSAEDLPKLNKLIEIYRPFTREISDNLYGRLPPGDRPDFLAFLARRWAELDLLPSERLLAYDEIVAQARAQPTAPVIVGDDVYVQRNFTPQGANVDLVCYEEALCVHTIRLDQYRHRDFSVAPNDVVIDGGAYIGDTAVYFHHLTSRTCRIHSFELLATSAALYRENRRLNAIAPEDMVLTRRALSDRSGKTLRIAKTRVPAAARTNPDGDGEAIETISIDDYVEQSGLERVDFIKLDLEGGDVPALVGALGTIRRFRPKLALCLYHRWDDILTIPATLLASGVDYCFVFKWVHLREGWEAVLMCLPVAGPVS